MDIEVWIDSEIQVGSNEQALDIPKNCYLFLNTVFVVVILV